MLYSMKHIVENLDISAKTLRFYEDQGILTDISRDERGRRVYSDQNLEWISFIRCLKETGMPLSKIKEYKGLYEKGGTTFSIRKSILMEHKVEVQNKIDEAIKNMEEISYKIAMYELQEEEVKKNPNYNFKCHGLEMRSAK